MLCRIYCILLLVSFTRLVRIQQADSIWETFGSPFLIDGEAGM